MFSTHEPSYSYTKPPIMLVSREEEFFCLVCKKRGVGPPNAKVHQGKCRVEHTRKIAKEGVERRKRRAAKAQLAASIQG